MEVLFQRYPTSRLYCVASGSGKAYLFEETGDSDGDRTESIQARGEILRRPGVALICAGPPLQRTSPRQRAHVACSLAQLLKVTHAGFPV